MRRFIDVIFVDPKIKRYVVLHQGEFWQLPRLNLSVNAWSLKQPYTGELSDIFVAKEQGVACAELAQTLKTYDLPPQLHGLSAIGFLGWWQTNDYKWLSTKDVLTLDGTVDTAVNTAPTAPPSTAKVSTPVQKPLQEPSVAKPANPQASSANAPKTTIKPDGVGNVAPTPTNKPANPPKQDTLPQDILAKATPQPATRPVAKAVEPTATPTAKPAPKPSTLPKAEPTAEAPKPATPAPKPKSADGELDIFDNLLNELTEEILHPH